MFGVPHDLGVLAVLRIDTHVPRYDDTAYSIMSISIG
jgi:hypothetical protein